MSFAAIPANQVLVTVGAGSMLSAIGTSETHRAANIGDPNMIGFAAFDARLVDIDPQSAVDAPVFLHREGDSKGQPISIGEINERWGNRLLEDNILQNMGSRFLPAEMMAADLPTDIGAPLPHRLERGSEPGGLRERAGLRFADLRGSPLGDNALLFDDDPRLGPSLQAQMFLHSGLGALAALPRPLSEIIPSAHRFRVAAATCFTGHDAYKALEKSMQKGKSPVFDKFAYRLASDLHTHGQALLSTMLSPAFPLGKVRTNPEILEQLIRNDSGSIMYNVPQAPLVSSAACASAFLTFNDIAPQLLLSGYPGFNAPEMVLWASADASLLPDARILEGFGPAALMTREKLAKSGRPVWEALAPFDPDAEGTIVSHAAYATLVTTLPFALANFLDITSFIVGWGQSSETGGKQHFAGVGYGGENAIIASLRMAYRAHGYGVDDFGHVESHGTGTRTNSKTDLNTLTEARRRAAEEQGYREKLKRMTVGAPKAAIPGVGHPMGPAGHLATEEGTHYLQGHKSVGIPTWRRPDPDLAQEAEMYELSAKPVDGNEDGGVIEAVQGFGGYVAAMARRSANAQSIRRHAVSDEKNVDAYLERWPEIRRERLAREARANRTIGSALRLAVEHRWPGAK